jgi:hypothetical protein
MITRRAGSQEGFSLVEVLVSALVLCIGILALTYQQVAQRSQRAGLETQNIGRRQLEKLVNAVMFDPYRFPYLYDTGQNRGILYVGCFDPWGAPIPTDPGAIQPNVWDFIGTFQIDPNRTDAQGRGLMTSPITTPDVCPWNQPQNQGGFEVHVAPDPTDARGTKLSIVVVIVTPPTTNQPAVQNFRYTSWLTAPVVFFAGWSGLVDPLADEPRAYGGWCKDVAGVAFGPCKNGINPAGDCVLQTSSAVNAFHFCY